MSSPDRDPRPVRSRRLAQPLLAGLIVLGVSACFRPLYGPTASGASMQSMLAAVDVAPITAPLGQERVTHYLRSELVFDLDGSGQRHPKHYKLTVAVAERLQTPIVDTVSGRAESATLVVNADYTLATLDGTRVITKGIATASATYDRNPQRFASVRAARDAEIRVAKLLSDQIKSRLAAVLARSS
jgi:LPS-assembly lipoprotein